MSYDEDEEEIMGDGFKVNADDEDEPLETPELPEDDDDPENRFH